MPGVYDRVGPVPGQPHLTQPVHQVRTAEDAAVHRQAAPEVPRQGGDAAGDVMLQELLAVLLGLLEKKM